MPVVFRKENSESKLILWKISENEQLLRELVAGSDIDYSNTFSNQKRRMQFLAWRAALRTVLPDGQICYDSQTGAPYLKESALHISAAHSDDMAVVMISRVKCAVDIENSSRNFADVAQRFISTQEILLGDSNQPHFACALWCSKEVLYKFSGLEGLDFKKDLLVSSMDISSGRVLGRIGADKWVEISLEYFGQFLLAFTV